MDGQSNNLTMKIIIAILVVILLATAYLFLMKPKASNDVADTTAPTPAATNQNTNNELPPTAPASDTTAGTRLAGDPALEEMDDKDMTADGGAEPLPEMMKKDESDAMMDKEDDVMVEEVAVDPLPLASGTFEDYSASKLALAETGDVVLFFHAPWCPSCRGLENDINANLSVIPEGVHILKVDYDSATELKKQYGVVRQHTLVRVDAAGNEIGKLTGLTNTLNQVVGQL